MKSSTTRALVAKKQSTFSAQVANSIKNLLQGYTKGIRFVAVLTILLSLGIGQAWGAEGDIIKSFDCTVSSSTTYARYTPSCDDIKWNISWGQTNYIGTNKSSNYANLKISNSTDLNAAKGVNSTITSSTQGYVTIIPQSAMSRVGKITITCTALSGSPQVYVVSSTSLSTSYSQIKLKTGNGLSAQGATMSTSGLTFKFDTQNQETYYAVVLYSTAWYRLTNTSIEFIEGASAPTCTPLEMSTVTATPGDSKITLTWSAVDNASNYTVTCPGGTVGSVTGASTKTCTITGLTNGTSYNWSVMPVGDGTTYCEENTPATGSTTPNATYSITYHDKDGAHSVDALGGSALLEVLPNSPTSCDIDVYPYFVGWSTTDIPSGGTTEQPTLVSTEIVNSTTASKTYYAVWSDVAPNAGGGSWEKATSISVGDKVVFVHEEKKRELTGVANDIGTATERTNGIPNGIEGTYVLTVEAGTANNSYSFKNGNIYLSWSSGNNLYTSTTKDNASSWTINTSTDGNFKFANVGTTSRILQFNSSSPRWACYTSSQSAFQIYKQSVATGTAMYITTCTIEPSYSVTYNGNGNTSGSVPNDTNSPYKENAEVTVLGNTGNLEKTGYTFNGWNTESDGTGTRYTAGETFTISKKTTLYAQWEAIPTYTVTFDSDGGSAVIAQTIEEGKTATKPNDPTKAGYTFVDWYNGDTEFDFDTPITDDITLKAKWTINQYTVTLNPNYPDEKTGTFTYEEGELVDGNLVLTYDYNTASMMIEDLYTSLTLDEYEFGGWYNAKGVNPGAVSGSKCTETKTITGNKTYYAKWSKLHTVTFNTGTNNPTVDAMEGTSETGITLPAGPTPACSTDGWEFAGWWTEEVGATTTSPGELLTAGSNYKPTEDCTLYAVYSKEETEEGGSTTPTEATLSFASKDQRTSFSSTQQVWEQNGIILTNTKGSDNNDANVGDYANPARFYANSEIIIKVSGNITQIVFECTENASELKNSVGVEATYNENIVTIIPTASSNTYTIAKLTKQVKMSSLTVTYLGAGGGSTITYNSNPSCEVCDNIITISKGAEANGNTFELDKSGDFETCEDAVVVRVTPTPAEHYSVSEVTATTPTSGGAPTVTNNDNGTWTVTYTQNSTGGSTINVTFVPDAKASITLSELGVTTTDNTTYYVGETYTLPSTSSQSCDGKQLVGWSTVEVAETDTKPTENYYELGAEVTLEATQTFYAVFATEGEGGGGEYTLVTSANDFTDGVYVIAALDNSTYYFIDGQYTGDGIGVESTGLPVSKMSNNSFTELPSSAVEIEIEDDEDPDGENHYYFISYYDETISKWKFLDDNGTNKTLEWVEWFDGLTVYTYHPVFGSKTYLLSGSGAAISQNGTTKASFIRNYENGTIYNSLYFFKKTGSSTSYSAYTTSCIPTYSITYDFAGGTGSHCSNTSVPQGEKYTICEEEPIKEGHTFQGWSDGTSTYAAGTTITPTKNTTLTAQWQINTYTVTWSNNGVTTLVTYEHGDDLTLPSAPESCDGVKEFVGWTEDNTFTYHATTPPSDIFTEKTATVTADATYYAVFATKGEGSANFVLGESGTFKMYANVEGTNYYAQGGVSSNKITSTTEAANASDYTLTYADGVYTIKQGTSNVGNKTNDADLNTNETTWTISEGTNGSWRVTSNATTNATVRALSYSYSNNAFKAYATTNIESGSYYDIEFGGTSSGYSDYTTICQQIESIEVQNPKTEFYLTNDFTIGEGKVMVTLSGGGTTDVTALATFSGYNMNVVGIYTVTVTYMGATATYDINVKPLDNAWVLTWNVSGKTNTGLGPRYVTKGSAIGTLPTPEVPAACEGKTFMGWTTSNIVNSDGTGITYITSETVPTDNTTYYAVFATINNFCTQKPIEDIASGSKVVIVAVASLTADGGSGKAISSRATDDTYNLQGDDVAIYDQTINTPHSTCIWTITKSGEKYIFTQDGKYLNGIIDGSYSNLKYNNTSDSWRLPPAASGMAMTYNMNSTNASTEYVEWYNGKFTIHDEVNKNGDFDMQFYVTANADGNADITDYTTGCEEYTITYYGFRGGYSTSTSSDGIIVLPVNSMHTVPDCGDVVTDHTNLGREFLDVWMTQPHGGHTFKPGDTFILTQDTTLYAQWKLETTSDVTTLPTDIEDMAGTDIYVYGGKTLNIQPGSTTINSLTLKGGIQSDGSYKMPIVWVPEGATLVRNSNKIYLDLVVNAKNYYPFAVPFATKNDQYIDYLDPVLNAASTYDKHFVIKTYDGARRATKGEDRANNWVKVLRHQSAENPSYLQPGVGYIIQALTYPDKDTATIRIPMTVPNTWFENGEQAVVGTTVRNTIAVTAHGGAAATEHQRHAGWNFVANPYLTSFAGGNVANDGGLAYINGELTVNGGWQYGGDPVPYVTIPAYDFSYYTQHKLSDVKLSPEWSFFVQIGTSGAMNFSTDGRQEIPASIAARHDAAQSIRMDVDIVLSDKHHSDQMGLIICDRFTSAYEIGYDLEKMFGSAYNLTVYTLMEDNTPLAYQALAIHSNMQVIPVGYRVPEQGDYTFALNQSTSSIDLLNEQYDQLILVDYETGALTNLLNSSYTFTSPRTQSNSRFAIYAVMRQDIPTDLPNIDDGDTSTRKILHNGHLYILRDGKVYNGHGQIVK